ncbi:MAG TPA: hemolysin family protein [Candidatus Intestinimonas pullistercoris]|uniref:Hemolysin family protein n=1 Tax=Candidatus Intestinimonas pullistercoris TaxID=2838623 RepID=A0A9D2NYZ5_9FIRM|nr:hemolysin family protein [Candidatus Intestinimonas pullistercoris]
MLLQVVLILLNAFFASTEIAVLSLNENLLRREAEEGDKKAARLLKIVQAPTKFLSTIQIGITLAGFLGAAFAAENFASRITAWLVDGLGFSALPREAVQSVSVSLITLVISFFTLIFGELVPKRVAMKKAEMVARFASGVVYGLSVVMSPVIALLTLCTNGVLRLMGIDPNADEEEVSEEGIRMMVDIGEEKGAIEADEKEMIENVFEFNDTVAEDVMVHRTDMVMVWAGDTDQEIVETIESTGLSRFPVYEEDADDIIGILSSRDYFLNSRKESPKPLRELLRPAYFVPESVPADVLFRDMQSRKTHMAIVVDEYGGTSGLLTMEDLLEEIVGNIYDEFDPQEAQEIIQLEPNLWRVAGGAELDDVAAALDLEFPEDEEADTLSGLIFDQLPVIPKDGPSQVEVEAAGLHIKVESVADRRVAWALVSKLPQGGEETEEKK